MSRSSSSRRSWRFSTSAKALVYDHIIGSFAATLTFHRFKWTQISGSPVKGNATEENFRCRRTPNSKASQPFVNCIEEFYADANYFVDDENRFHSSSFVLFGALSMVDSSEPANNIGSRERNTFTTAGSNSIPARSASSRLAFSELKAGRNGRPSVSAAYESATRRILAARGISSRRSASG